MRHQITDWNGKPSKWPATIECGQDGCTEQAELMEDEGNGYCVYYCPVHESFGCQFDDDEDDYDPDLDFGFEVNPYEHREYEDEGDPDDYEWVSDLGLI